jgi:electron transport complex protein RnfE
MGIGFLVALLAMAIIREILGTGAIDLSSLGMESISIPVLCDYNIPLLTSAPGGFLVYGILIAIVNKIGPKAGSEKRKNFSCEGCPSASICGRVSCSENAELVCAAEENTLVEKEDK